MSEETDSLLYYNLPAMASTVRSLTPQFRDFESALINAGYTCSRFHHEPEGIKTNAPDYVMWDIMRFFCLKSNALQSPKNLTPTALTIQQKEMQIKVNVTRSHGQQQQTNPQLSRYPKNPEKHWGPKRKGLPKDAHSSEESSDSTSLLDENRNLEGVGSIVPSG